jgi:hypothetical protein
MKEGFDPELLDEALSEIVRNASAARDAFLLGNDFAGRAYFDSALGAFAHATYQLSLKPKENEND